VRIDGARVWITGASSGIGRALARELARRGARVAISARRVERLDQLAAEDAMLPVPVDVTDLASMRRPASNRSWARSTWPSSTPASGSR
jgi:NADP-dependent 3-hydroxy acid dehydrogenase YdfG